VTESDQAMILSSFEDGGELEIMELSIFLRRFQRSFGVLAGL